MKPIKITKKLSLKKELISKLNCPELNTVLGGKRKENQSCYHSCTCPLLTDELDCF